MADPGGTQPHEERRVGYAQTQPPTSPPPPPPPREPPAGVIQVVVLPRMRPEFEAWLAERGMVLAIIPVGGPGDLPTYKIDPDPERCAYMLRMGT
jgi:hypothetical protein